MARRKIIITVETYRLTILRTPGSASAEWCAACGAGTPMLTVESAASLYSLTQRAIFRMIETDCLHFNETPEGELLICAESLRRLA